MVTVRRHVSATDFLAAAGTFLGRREAEHNLFFGICHDLALEAANGVTRPRAPYVATVVEGDEIIAAALWTPPRLLILSMVAPPAATIAAMSALATDLGALEAAPSGVLGRAAEWGPFADAWCPPRGLVATIQTGERIHRLERLTPPRGVPGAARLATADDRALLTAWTEGFLIDAFGEPDPEEARSVVDRGLRIGSRRFFLWEVDGRPVSYAAAGGPTPNGGRIGPVYTPREHRGHGYAAAATAAATQSILVGGARFVFLLTDRKNETAERVYARLGYEPVSEIDAVGFGAGDDVDERQPRTASPSTRQGHEPGQRPRATRSRMSSP